ncbi:hypothetical protein [Kribbella sp. NPDC051718]|uniref:hypothetical protein n=1 Tax=Kribbella sp. NPDC051718 TaxID=3155168 RepID=UPI0034216CCC
MSKRIVINCAAQINSSGPLSPDDLAPAVLAAGLTKSTNPAAAVRTALRQSPVLVQLPDGRFDTVRRMLDGAALTHRVHSPTKGRQVLFAGPELALLDLLLLHEGSLPLASGEAITSSIGEFGGWCGPPDWLPDVPADSLLAFRLHNGRLSVEPVPHEPALSSPSTDRLRTVLKRHLKSSDPLAEWQSRHTLATLLLRALAEIPDLLRDPLPPLDEVLQLGQPHWSPDWHLPPTHPPGPSSSPPYPGSPAPPSPGSPASPYFGSRGFALGTQRIVLDDLPAPLTAALRRDAANLGVSVGELTILLLSAATYRTALPCRHDAEEAWLANPVSSGASAADLIESSHQ